MKPSGKGPRAFAMKVLSRFDPYRHNTDELISKYINQTDRPGQGIDIIFGVIRNRDLLDRIIAKISGRQIKQIHQRALDILRIAIYELIYTSNQPYAIVNEAVELTTAASSKRSAGFVNAILRKTADAITNKSALLSKNNPRKTIPVKIGFGCAFNFDLLKSPQENPTEYLACAFSLPKPLIKGWLDNFGFEETLDICFACNRRPSIYIRPNRLKIAFEKLCEKFKAANIDYQSIEIDKMIKLSGVGNITNLPGFNEGLFTIQDITAAKAVKLLNPQPGWTILDLCSAPGTKTTQLAELMKDKGTIIATDINSQRLKKVNENTKRLNITSVNTTLYKQLESYTKNLFFDAVLLDAPCSNSGVLAKRPEVRYRINQKKIKELAETQSQLLLKAAAMLKPNGKICYSTCSIEKQENFEVVEHFLANEKTLELQKQQFSLPRANAIDCDGGYTAILNRK